MRVLLAAAIILSISLAGCSETAANEPSQAVDEEPVDAGNVTALPSPPTAMLGVDFLNGTAPLMVNFTINGTNATHWAFDFGEGNSTNGTVFPAMVNHTYTAGLHNFSLMVTGANGTAWQNGTVNVTALAEPEVVLEPFSEVVTMDLNCPACGDAGTSTCTWRVHGNGAAQDCAWIEFGPDYAGQPFTLVGEGLDADLLFWETCNSGVGPKFHALGDEEGLIPAGMTCVLVWEQLDPMVDLVFTITPV